MAFDFPASPTVGQTVTNAGVVYRWDGTKWVAQSASGALPPVIYIGDTPPLNPVSGTLWFDSVSGQLFVWYVDPSSSQWVPSNAPLQTQAFVPVSGGTMTGPLVLSGDPAADMQPATRRYVDATTQDNVGRNLAMNGTFAVAQRGVGPFTTPVYTLDRWVANSALDAWSFTQAALTNADRAAIGDESAQYCLRNVFTGTAAAGAYTSIQQCVENLYRTTGKTLIISFWAVASAPLKLGVSLYVVPGTGGSPAGGGWAQANAPTVNLTTTWARYSATIPVPSSAGVTLGTNGNHSVNLNLCYSSGATNAATFGNTVQSGAISIWGVQIEVAQPGQTQPTPLEQKPYADTLRDCMRFFQVWNPPPVRGVASASVASVSRMGMPLPVPMRAAPVVTLVSPLPVYNGVTPTTITSITNYPSTTALEFDGVTAVAWGANTLPAMVYLGAGGSMTLSADF